jgi:hypothetical protein
LIALMAALRAPPARSSGKPSPLTHISVGLVLDLRYVKPRGPINEQGDRVGPDPAALAADLGDP